MTWQTLLSFNDDGTVTVTNRDQTNEYDVQFEEGRVDADKLTEAAEAIDGGEQVSVDVDFRDDNEELPPIVDGIYVK